jgi:hypothetical protein
LVVHGCIWVQGFPAAYEGNVYVSFADAAFARSAAISLSGRKFADRIVDVEYVRTPAVLTWRDRLMTVFLLQFDEAKFAQCQLV